jgi:alpha-beta hydrolase superfamily lysophospholipase
VTRTIRLLLLCSTLFALPALAFQPSAKYAADPNALGLKFNDVSFRSSRDSVLLHGWWFAGRDTAPIVVVCPSETGNMADKLWSVREWVARGFSVLAFDLRDTGPASAGDVDSLHEVVFSSRWVNDSEGALRFAREKSNGRPVVAWGQDMGGALAFAAAGRQRGNADAIAIEGLFRTSQEQLLWLGLSQDPAVVLRHRILVHPPDEPASMATRMRTQVFAVVAGKDEVTPPAVTQQLLSRVPAARETWLVPDGGHVHLERTPGYFDRVADGLRRALARERNRWRPR